MRSRVPISRYVRQTPLWGAFALSLLGCGAEPPPGPAALPAQTPVAARQQAVVMPPAPVHGVAYALVQDGSSTLSIAVPNVQLKAKNVATGVSSPASKSNAHGWYRIGKLVPGRYVICWTATGFNPGCTTEEVQVNGELAHAPPVRMTPKDRYAFGRVLLAEGKSPYFASTFMKTSILPTVNGGNAMGRAVGSKVAVNAEGFYVLGGLPATATQVIGHAEASAASGMISVAGSTHRVDLNFLNHSPQVKQIVLRDPSLPGSPAVRKSLPGKVLTVTVQASDPEKNDRLTYLFTTNTGKISSVRANTAKWALPPGRGVNTIYVLVRDKKGGATLYSQQVNSSTPDSLFSGKVVDSLTNMPIAGAKVSAGAMAVNTTSTGTFAFKTPTRERFVININKDGYLLYSRVVTEDTLSRTYRMMPANKTSINPTMSNMVNAGGQREGLTLELAPNSLVDEAGNLPTGMLDVYVGNVDTSDPVGRMPGDYGSRNAMGGEGYMQTYGAVDIRVRDSAGTRYNLAPGKTARLTMPISASQMGTAPATLRLWRYNEGSGEFDEGNSGIESFTKMGANYVATVTHFSVLNVDVEKTDPACMRVHVDPTSSNLTLPFDVRLTIPTGTGTDAVYTRTVGDQLNVITRLPPNEDITIEVLDSTGNPIAAATQVVNSGNTIVGPQFPAYPYDSCNSDAYLSIATPSSGTFLDYSGLGSAADAALYYSIIDPTSSKTTLSDWKTANGWGSDDADAVYGNDLDLGFGRWMHMRNPGTGDIGYYVSNYATADIAGFAKSSNDENLGLIATVAMEYSAHPMGGARYTKFYVFNSSGNRVDSADLDGNGAKFIPQLCIVCHGGSYTTPDAVNQGNFDSRFIPFPADAFSYPSGVDPAYSQANQEADLRAFNEGVLVTNYSDSIQDQICGWYGAGAGCTGALPAVNQNTSWVPDAWSAPVDQSALYNGTVKYYCRACHTTRNAPLDWAQWDDAWDGSDDGYNDFKDYGSLIDYVVCNGRVMPNAQVTYNLMWASTAPHAPAQLVAAGLDGWSSATCPP